MMKIGIYAGAFDPVHDGHIAVAKAAVSELGLDKLVFMVEEQPWGSKQPVSVTCRRDMVDLALAGTDNLSRFETEDKRFSIDTTLAQIENQFSTSELYFVFGGDVFMSMNAEQWPGLDKLLHHYIVVFERAGVTEADITNHARGLGIVTAIITSPHPDHSSTRVRMMPHQKSVYVPKNVAEYIDENGLY